MIICFPAFVFSLVLMPKLLLFNVLPFKLCSYMIDVNG